MKTNHCIVATTLNVGINTTSSFFSKPRATSSEVDWENEFWFQVWKNVGWKISEQHLYLTDNVDRLISDTYKNRVTTQQQQWSSEHEQGEERFNLVEPSISESVNMKIP